MSVRVVTVSTFARGRGVTTGGRPAGRAVLTPLLSKTRRGGIVQAILRSIFTGKYAAGDRLVEAELALTLGVSRTPVREALGELASVGLIDLKPNRGAVVRPFGPRQVREVHHLRRILEAEAARLATPRLSRDLLLEVRQRSRQLLHADIRPRAWSQAAIALDEHFHALFSTHCGNPRLAAEIERYCLLVGSLRQVIGNTAHAVDAALVEHTVVLDHALARNADGAADAMARHLDQGALRAVNALFASGSACAG